MPETLPSGFELTLSTERPEWLRAGFSVAYNTVVENATPPASVVTEPGTEALTPKPRTILPIFESFCKERRFPPMVVYYLNTFIDTRAGWIIPFYFHRAEGAYVYGAHFTLPAGYSPENPQYFKQGPIAIRFMHAKDSALQEERLFALTDQGLYTVPHPSPEASALIDAVVDATDPPAPASVPSEPSPDTPVHLSPATPAVPAPLPSAVLPDPSPLAFTVLTQKLLKPLSDHQLQDFVYAAQRELLLRRAHGAIQSVRDRHYPGYMPVVQQADLLTALLQTNAKESLLLQITETIEALLSTEQ